MIDIGNIKKEIYLIIASFLILAVVVFTLMGFVFYQIEGMHKVTAAIYNHPLKVSNAALSVKSEVVKINKDIKEIIHFTSEGELKVLIDDIRTHETHIDDSMAVIENNILGDSGKKLHQHTLKLLKEWEKLYNKIINFVKNGQTANAIEINKTENLEFALKLESSLTKVYEYAQNKANHFKTESDKLYKEFELTETLILIIIVFTFLYIAFFTVKKISVQMSKNEHLKGVLDVIRSVNQSIVREKDRDKLLEEVCNILASKHVFTGAWIVLINKNNELDYVYGTDTRTDFEALKNKIKSGWSPACIKETLKKNNTYSFIEKTKDNCTSCPLMDLYGGQGAFNIALKNKEKVFGYLTLSVDSKYIKYGDEIELLKEVSKDIAYALQNIDTVKKIADLKELNENIIDSVENLIFVKDTDFNYIACNRAFEKFIGKSRDEIIGKSDYDIVNKKLADLFRENDIRMLAEKRAKSNFEWVTYPDGREVYLLTVKSPLVNSKGSTIGLVGNSTDLTKQKILEEHLKLAKKRYEEAEKIGKVGSWEYFIKEDEFWGSKEAKRIYGLNVDTNVFDHETIENCIPEKERVHKALVDLIEKKEEYDLKFEIHPYDGSPAKIITSVARVEYDKDEKPVKVRGVIRDVTESALAEKRLIQSEKKFKLLMKESPSVIEIYDLEGNQIEVNRAYEELWQIPASLTLNKFNLFKSQEVEKRGLLEYIKRAYAGENVTVPIYEFDSRGVTEANGKGRVRKLNTRIYPLKDTYGNVKNIVITHEDVTDKENSIAQLKEKKRELENIIQGAPNPMIMQSEDGKIIMLNQAWVDAIGYDKEDMPTVNELIEKLFEGEEEIKRVKEHVKSLYNITTKIDEGEFTFTSKNNEKLTWQFSSAPLGIIDGKKVILSSAMDVTELKKKDEIMIAQSRHAAMGEMIGMIAHQWRQPISVVSMVANNILLDIALGEFDESNAEKYSKDILEQTEHLSQTIDDFRNFFKPEKAKSIVTMQSVIDETMSIVKDSLINNNIVYEVKNTTDKEVEAYQRELMQVFVNIITNAKDKLVQENTKEAKIDILIYEDGKYVTTEICDNGSAINDDILPKIFDPYFTTKDENIGTGLGLYMSKMIVEDHLKGKIEAKNVDDGVCFTVSLLKVGELKEDG